MQIIGAAAPGNVSDLIAWVEALATEGRAVVSGRPLQGGGSDAMAALIQLDSNSRAELALDAPALCPDTALWAATLFYQLCQFTVRREIGEERIAAVCHTPCPMSRGPETDWSADLVLRHLPRLFQFARYLSNADPLVDKMKRIGATWPLSSVGSPGLGELRLDPFIYHPALRRLYLDRIVATKDVSRLGDPRLDDLLRADIGIYRDLSPEIAEKLFKLNS
jgi:hypothetical protein